MPLPRMRDTRKTPTVIDLEPRERTGVPYFCLPKRITHAARLL